MSGDMNVRSDMERRLHRAEVELSAQLREAELNPYGRLVAWRLKGKIQGVQLALDYLRAYP